MKFNHYRPAALDLWKGRQDSSAKERLYQYIKTIDITKDSAFKPELHGFAIIGFSCDTGIKRNKGRPGARQGPELFRNYFGNLASFAENKFFFYDLGDVHCDDDNLEASQEELAELILWAINNKLLPLVIGGGHEVSWPGFLASAKAKQGNIGIINFDAHLDLRPHGKEPASSGNSFSQAAQFCYAQNRAFNYLVIGLQESSATTSLLKAAQEHKANYISAEEIHRGEWQKAHQRIDTFIAKNSHIYLTICLDVFAQAFAPGVSAPQPLGLLPGQVLGFFRQIIGSAKVLAIDIAELSPPHDEDDKTARLSASLLYALLADLHIIKIN